MPRKPNPENLPEPDGNFLHVAKLLRQAKEHTRKTTDKERRKTEMFMFMVHGLNGRGHPALLRYLIHLEMD